jgi:hypothetical protein
MPHRFGFGLEFRVWFEVLGLGGFRARHLNLVVPCRFAHLRPPSAVHLLRTNLAVAFLSFFFASRPRRRLAFNVAPMASGARRCHGPDDL